MELLFEVAESSITFFVSGSNRGNQKNVKQETPSERIAMKMENHRKSFPSSVF